MRCVGRVTVLMAAFLAASPFAFMADAEAQTRGGGFSAVGKSRFAPPPMKMRPTLSRAQQRNLIAQQRVRQVVRRADRAFAWPPQANVRFDRRRGVFNRPAAGGFIGGYSYGVAGGFSGNGFYSEPQAAAAPVRGGPVSINDIPASTGIAAAPTPEPAFYDIRRDGSGQTRMVRRQGARIVKLGMPAGQGEPAQGATGDVSGPRIIRIP